MASRSFYSDCRKAKVGNLIEREGASSFEIYR